MKMKPLVAALVSPGAAAAAPAQAAMTSAMGTYSFVPCAPKARSPGPGRSPGANQPKVVSATADKMWKVIDGIPDREGKLNALRALLKRLPADETAVFMDEVDVNLNPKVGCQWMRRGAQAAVETPGTNEKRYLAGSINWRTGALVVTEDYELMVSTLQGTVIKMAVSDISVFGRATQGVRVIRLGDNDTVGAVTRVIPEDDQGEADVEIGESEESDQDSPDAL